MNHSQLDPKLEPRQTGVSHVRVATITDEGGRERNEDAFVALDVSRHKSVTGHAVESLSVGPRGVLLAVADGMGGHADGDVASSMAISGLKRMMMGMRHSAPGPVFLHNAVQLAHREVWNVARRMSDAERMGTTLTAIQVRGRVAHVAHVGDSRAYVLRGGVLHRLTRDQSYTQMLIDEGALRANEAHLSPFPNVILQAIGHAAHLKIALATLELRQRDVLLVCSDGLTNALTDDRIATIIEAAPGLDAAAAELVTMGTNPPDDNVTLVLGAVAGNLPAFDPSEPFEDTHHVLQDFGRRAAPKGREAPDLHS